MTSSRKPSASKIRTDAVLLRLSFRGVATATNPESRADNLWIPGSLALRAPRNDGVGAIPPAQTNPPAPWPRRRGSGDLRCPPAIRQDEARNKAVRTCRPRWWSFAARNGSAADPADVRGQPPRSARPARARSRGGNDWIQPSANMKPRAELHQSAPIAIARAMSKAVAILPDAPILMRSRALMPTKALWTKLTPSRIGMPR